MVGYAFVSLALVLQHVMRNHLITRCLVTAYNGFHIEGHRQISFALPERELETYVQQIQLYPYIHLSLRFSRAPLPMGNLPLFRRAMFPCRLSPFG